MADTTHFGWTKAAVGGDDNAWGTILNTLFDDIDTDLNTVKTTADAALPKAGGVMTGRLDAKTGTMARVDKGSVSGAVAFDLAAGQYFTLTVGGAVTAITFTNVAPGALVTGMIWRVTNGGSAAITWPASVKWAGGVAPALSSAGVDVLVFITDDNGTTWRALVAGLDVK